MPVDKHYSTVVGGVLTLLTLEPMAEMLLGLNIVGSLGPEVMGPSLTVIVFIIGVLMMTKGGTRAAEFVEELVQR
ncbi:hypothetical protein ACK3SF_03110 [Candidatus Nanosalina sp. VS9-1]|uniref:hypothetical protein n=1 Tax=Candidatus Nanosalina sp. VS9-1 TaxID=3388566 RepID=UPI0039DF97AC